MEPKNGSPMALSATTLSRVLQYCSMLATCFLVLHVVVSVFMCPSFLSHPALKDVCLQRAACKTEKGISLLMIERDDNLTTNPIKTSYSPAAGTAYVLYENVKVQPQLSFCHSTQSLSQKLAQWHDLPSVTCRLNICVFGCRFLWQTCWAKSTRVSSASCTISTTSAGLLSAESTEVRHAPAAHAGQLLNACNEQLVDVHPSPP